MIAVSQSKQLHPLIQRTKTLLLIVSAVLMIANLYTLTSTKELARSYTYKQHKATWFLFYLTKEFTELVSIMPHALDTPEDLVNVKLKYELTWSRFDLILHNSEADEFLEIDGTLHYFKNTFDHFKLLESLLVSVNDEQSLANFTTRTEALYQDVIQYINDNFKIQSPMYLEQKAQAEYVTNIQYALILLLFFSIGLVSFIWYKEAQYHRLLALTDPLTDIGNRLSMFRSISHRPNSSHYSLFLLDLNGFKAINDDFGHLAGDSVLQQVTKRLSHIPTFDYELFRMGGDEFALIINSVEPLELEGMKSLIEQCFEHKFVVGDNQYRALNTSIGISSYPNDATDINQLIHIADQKMYVMKHQKKGPSL
ncbi:GGDEF domain-containing protein [Vibrio diazotrophicus]|uniref:Diguanylate cyclase (GGDEF)-like protein n=1 Tax=Vibrio diazotrophicus TaxID=685 RepID=A0A329EE30_VIBDI|nr:GGDEF domain-containing protein [Vibrio diazotrophicus]PNI03784.1 GGDEF domain-containing protein [Vibrio diazotrophicus]RAS69447.1 diguanylate cyclase (GGDEF)-like protein [Vibrio diazotrophicus]